MAFDRRGYYYRSQKVGKRVTRRYLGNGEAAQIAARMHAAERDRRERQRAAEKAQRDRLAAIDGPLRDLDRAADLGTAAAMLAAGYRMRKREWRKPWPNTLQP